MTFATVATLGFNLDEHSTNAAVNVNIDQLPYSEEYTCTGRAMAKVAEEVLCTTCAAHRAEASKVVLFLTDGNPSPKQQYCSSGGSVDRNEVLKTLKSLSDRIVPVGIGDGVATQYLETISHNMPLGKDCACGVATSIMLSCLHPLPRHLPISPRFFPSTSPPPRRHHHGVLRTWLNQLDPRACANFMPHRDANERTNSYSHCKAHQSTDDETKRVADNGYPHKGTNVRAVANPHLRNGVQHRSNGVMRHDERVLLLR